MLARVDTVEITDADFERALDKLDAGAGTVFRSLEEWRRQFQLLIDRELLTHQAREQGLEHHEQVRRQVEAWERARLIEALLSVEKGHTPSWEDNLAFVEHLVRKYELHVDEVAMQHLLQAAGPDSSARLVRSTLGDWTVGHYLRALKRLPSPEGNLPTSAPALGFQVTRTFIVDQLLVLEARERGIYEELRPKREQVRRQKMIEALLQRQILARVPITEAELKAYYEAHKARYAKEAPSAAGAAVAWRARIARDLREEKAAPLYEAYIAELRRRYEGLIAVEDERFQEFVARRRRAESPVEF